MRVNQFNQFAIHIYLVLACSPNCLRISGPKTRQVPELGAGDANTKLKTIHCLPSEELKLICNMVQNKMCNVFFLKCY